MIARYRTTGPLRTCNIPVIAHVPNTATTSVCTAASSVPTPFCSERSPAKNR